MKKYLLLLYIFSLLIGQESKNNVALSPVVTYWKTLSIEEKETLKCTSTVSMTASLTVLSDLARGEGPKQAILALGYAGWAPGQLENEIASNCWLFGKLDDQEIFSLDFENKWSNSLKNSGVEPSKISSNFGSA